MWKINIFLLLLNFSFAFSLPSFVNWSYEGAYKEENGIRGKICLNGYWKWKIKGEEEKPPENEWFYRKVPGIGQFFYIYDSNGKKVSKFKGDELAWIERDFEIPEEWKNRDVFIEIGNTKDGSKIFLDGKQIGASLPNKVFIYKIPLPYKNSYRLTVLTKGIIDNVFLLSFPSGNKIKNVFINPSFRKKEIEVEIEVEKNEKLDFSLKFYDYKSRKLEKEFKGIINSEKTNAKFKWENPKLWSLENPNLYNFVLEISKNGKIVDKTLPSIFGFKEFWIEDGDFYLNGKVLKLKSDSNVPFTMYSLGSSNRMGVIGNEEYIRNIVRGWKNLGLNSFHVFITEFLNPDIIFRVCDEEGYYIQVYMPSFSEYYQFLEDEEIKKYIEDAIGGFVRRIRQHPSLLFYFAGSGSHVWDYCPAKLDGSYNPDEIWGEDKVNKIIKPIVEKYDKTRPISYYSGGARDPIHTTMGYINFDSDLQVHENWPYFWYKKKPRPLLPTEFSLPYYQAWFLRTTRGPDKSENIKPAFVEFASIYFGNEVYSEILKNKENWKDGKIKIPGQAKEISDKLRALFVKNIIRSWRTYGISFAFHAEVRNFFKELKKPDIPNTDPRNPFYIPDQQSTEGDPFIDSPLTTAGIDAKKSLSPFLAYIGGPDGNFTLKDHTYFSDENIKKSAILINDYEENLTGTGIWEILDKETNNIIFKDKFNFKILSGERIIDKYQINFKAPKVKSRKDIIIRLKVSTEKGDNIEDEFNITVFPIFNPPIIKNEVYLYDPIGETKNLLDKARVKYKEINGYIPNDGILIIGRKVLSNEIYFKNLISWQTPKLLYNIDPAIKGGLKVIVFEQPLTNILGLKSEERRWRHAHISAPSHPIVKGLLDSDFSYLKGYSNLMPDYPDPGPPPKISFANPERFWMWGNDNVVVSFPIVKPYVGAFRPILSCGFDLMETPLCEFAIERGRIIFCQVDVTNRYGIDPVSTLLVNNLLEYIDKAEEPDTSMPEPIYALEEGHNLIEKEDYIFVPENIPDGLTISDFYFREILKLKTIDGQLFKKIKKDGKEIYIHSINLKDFKTRWQRTKGMRIIANLRINQGGSSNEGPSFALQGDEYGLYPINWLEGFVHPYTYWRW
jgi:beta-galactosidase